MRGNGWLWDVLYVVFHRVHVANVTGGVAATVSGKVSGFPTVEAGSFWTWAMVLPLWLRHCGVCVHIVFLMLDICGIPLILASIVGHPSLG